MNLQQVFLFFVLYSSTGSANFKFLSFLYGDDDANFGFKYTNSRGYTLEVVWSFLSWGQVQYRNIMNSRMASYFKIWNTNKVFVANATIQARCEDRLQTRISFDITWSTLWLKILIIILKPRSLNSRREEKSSTAIPVEAWTAEMITEVPPVRGSLHHQPTSVSNRSFPSLWYNFWFKSSRLIRYLEKGRWGMDLFRQRRCNLLKLQLNSMLDWSWNSFRYQFVCGLRGFNSTNQSIFWRKRTKDM